MEFKKYFVHLRPLDKESEEILKERNIRQQKVLQKCGLIH